MKKVRMSVLLFMMLLSIFLMGCNKTNSEDGKGTKDTDSQTNSNNPNGTSEEGVITIDPNSFAIVVDPQLKGMDLIRAAKVTNPINAITYDIKTVIGSGDTAYETIGTMIKSNGNYKVETETQGEGIETTIYNANEKMTYKYFAERKEGYKFLDDITSGEGPTIEGEYDLSVLYAEEANVTNAEVILYENEPVIYFEMLEGQNKVASWISLRYGMTIKTELYDGENLISSTVISNIKLPASISAATFVPPSDIAFEDYSVSGQETDPLTLGDETNTEGIDLATEQPSNDAPETVPDLVIEVTPDSE